MKTNIDELKKLMQKQIVHFEYLKKDGTVREANGTTNIDIINEHSEIEPESVNVERVKRNYNVSENSVRYYDIDKKGWRSFNKENFKSFED